MLAVEQTDNLILVPQREAARRLSISERKLFTETKEGRIRRVKVGVKVLYPVTELERYAADNLL